MKDSVFYTSSIEALNKEIKRLCDFTESLDSNPAYKKERIAEYKCAKYRYASVSLIQTTIYHNVRCRKLFDLKNSHHLLFPFDEIFNKHADYLELYDSVSDDEKPDYSLYYSMTAFADEETDKLKNSLLSATDWEKIELEERIDGLKFAKECLDKAWQQRKDITL